MVGLGAFIILFLFFFFFFFENKYKKDCLLRGLEGTGRKRVIIISFSSPMEGADFQRRLSLKATNTMGHDGTSFHQSARAPCF